MGLIGLFWQQNKPFFMRQNYLDFIDTTLLELQTKNKEINIKNCQQNIKFLEQKIIELNAWLRHHEFESEFEEIEFFKIHKNKLTTKLFYFKNLLELQIKMTSSKKKKRDYLKKVLEKYNQVPKGYGGFWKYYRSETNHRDREYYLRNQNDSNCNDQYHLVFLDERITTKMECPLAMLKAREQIITYLDSELEKLESKSKRQTEQIKTNLEWTGTNLDLIELIYALHHNKVINGGQNEVKEIAKALSGVFNVEIENNLYRYYSAIKNRKKEKSAFLYNLADTFNRVIESEQ